MNKRYTAIPARGNRRMLQRIIEHNKSGERKDMLNNLPPGTKLLFIICLAMTIALFMITPVLFAQDAAEDNDSAADVANDNEGGTGNEEVDNEDGSPTDEDDVTHAESVARVREDLNAYFPRWMQHELIGVTVWQFMLSFLFILLGMMLKKLSDYILDKRVIPVLKRSPLVFDHVFAVAISRPLGYFFLLGGFAGAFWLLPLPDEPNVYGVVFGLLKIALVVIIVWFLFRVVDASVDHLEKMTRRQGDQTSQQLMQMTRKALKATIGAICFVWGVQLLGYNVSSLIAGLGIGGLAVALALQDTLANFFGSIFILVDHPFRVGDWIKMGDAEGIVEDIGFRSTRIRSFPATLISVPNKNMANATIDNWSQMPKRRVMHTVGVTYETTPDQMEKAVAGIREILENDEGVHQEFIVVRFTEFGDSSLNIFLLYFTKAIGFADHAATRERVNLAIMRLLENLGLEIAFPTRTIYMKAEEPESVSGINPQG